MKSLIAKYALDIGPQKQGWLVMIFGFLGFVIWASTYPIDQGIPGAGFVIPKSEKISISSPASSAVISLLKKSGDHVVAGEVIVQLDPLSMQSSLQKLEESAAGLKGTIKTLERENQAKSDKITSLSLELDKKSKVIESL
jgi:multidrug efflux pump subunit AcrA (membrane-fusion protein)